MVGITSIDETRGLLVVDSFIKISVEKGVFDV